MNKRALMKSSKEIPMRKIQIFSCQTHDDSVCYIDGKIVFSNDYGVENVLKLIHFLGPEWKVEYKILSREEYEKLN